MNIRSSRGVIMNEEMKTLDKEIDLKDDIKLRM